MKAKYALIALLAITFFGCDDNTGNLGFGMFPDSDKNINGQLKTYPVITESVEAGRIYAKTNIGYVGKFTDETFGTYQAGFLSTLNCPTGLTFPGVYNGTAFDSNNKVTNTMVGEERADDDDIVLIRDKGNKVIGNIHTVELYLWYDTYFGDSLTACRLSVYELDKELEKADEKNAYYYTDIDPTEFYKENDAESLLGTKAYTAVDLSVKDSIRNLSTYVPSVHLALEKTISERVGGEILRLFRDAQESGSAFGNKEFLEAFKGIYVKSDYGDGTVLYVDQVQMNVVYKNYVIDSISGKPRKTYDNKDDSTYYAYRIFNSTREVIQANKLDNDEKVDELIQTHNNCTYLKTPAGIFTQATLPVNTISEELSGDTLNAVKLTFSNYNQPSSSNFGMSAPSNVMLIRSKEKERFFANNLLNDGVSSFLTSHTTSTNQYTFSNITRLINTCINDRKAAEKEIKENGKVNYTIYNAETGKDESKTTHDIAEWEKDTEWDKVVLIPVLVTYDSSSSNYGTSNVISIQHDLKPGYVKLKGGKLGESEAAYRLSLEVVYTSFTGTGQNN